MRCFRFFIVIIAAVLAMTEISFGAYDYIDINSPSIRKMPIAIPLFKSGTGTINNNDMIFSKQASNMLAEMLDFTCYFKILDRESFLENPLKPETTLQNINFHNWATVGAELLVTGKISIKGDLLEIELRLFDTIKASQLIGKKYKADAKSLNQVIRLFASEIVFYLTGNRGIFDTRIAFVSTGSGNKEIYICDFDGTNVKQFTNNKAITLFPAWSSDGKWIAYTSYLKGNPDIYIKNVNNNSISVIAKKGINITPVWVPGKFALAATLSYTGDQDIYLMTGTGKIIKKLTKSSGSDVSPALSTDGKKMAFVSSRSGTPQIYIKDLYTGYEKRLTFNGNYNTQPCWSPKGDKIVYSGLDGGSHNIFIIGFDGKNPVQLTQDTGNNESPSWSPDGTLIVFSSTREGPSRIYVMTSYGTDQRRVFSISGEQSNPKWSPRLVNK
ncbi:MAG: Tol-Pal system beta propeller repeat protein TolB [Proteobacteria bacterium]|nr:Tol-Pal system beta propeller repeat protein TolB [Pseudomonadota bacterium]